ncbi:cuticle protein 8-like [Aedes albopictus]|uniref:Uncharacterized protein n=1 Tax=Aedes albopictus TaxID=7160 RepID=A0ABM1Y540_AEDAL
MLNTATVLLVLIVGGHLTHSQNQNVDQSEEWDLARKSKGDIQQQEPQEKISESSVQPNYEFAYGVYDPITGDHKDQWEKRVGDHVQGVYKLDQPNGRKRIVEYEGDSKRGVEQTVKEVDGAGKVGRREQLNGIGHSYNTLKKIDATIK